MQHHHTFDSSNIAAATYDDVSLSLVVVFHRGARYRYCDVPPATWQGLVAAESAGRYFHANIKPLPTERMEDAS